MFCISQGFWLAICTEFGRYHSTAVKIKIPKTLWYEHKQNGQLSTMLRPF